MTSRILLPDEWNRLAGTDFGQVLKDLHPDAVSIVVVEDEAGAIIGCWGLITFAHVEGLWVAPEHRKRGRVLVHLWNAMRDLALSRGIRAVYTGAVSADVERLLASRGAEPQPPQWVLPLMPLERMH